MKYLVSRYGKAIQAAVGAGVLAVAAALLITSPGHITDREWFAVVAAIVGGAGGPAVGPANAPKRKKAGEAGQGAVGLALLVATFVGVVLLLFRVHLGG